MKFSHEMGVKKHLKNLPSQIKRKIFAPKFAWRIIIRIFSIKKIQIKKPDI